MFKDTHETVGKYIWFSSRSKLSGVFGLPSVFHKVAVLQIFIWKQFSHPARDEKGPRPRRVMRRSVLTYDPWPVAVAAAADFTNFADRTQRG